MSTYASVGLHCLCLRLLADVSFHVPVLLAIVHAMAWPPCRQNIHVLRGDEGRQQSSRQWRRCMSALRIGHRRAAYRLGLRVSLLLAIGILPCALSSLVHIIGALMAGIVHAPSVLRWSSPSQPNMAVQGCADHDDV